MATASPAYAAQGPVGLGTATSFAVLAGSGLTNTGATTITGDIGTFPTTSETGFGSLTLSGANHGGDAVTQAAKNDLVAAYNDAFGRKPVTNKAVELGGLTLLAGVYTSPTFGLTGTLTLDAKGKTDAQFIFQAGSTLITQSNSRVLLINGADPCHVVWQIGSSATFKTGTRFIGDVLAQTSITALTGATFEGRLLARDGAVTLDTNTITNANCAAPPPGGTTTTTAGTTTTGGMTTTTVASPSPGATPGGTDAMITDTTLTSSANPSQSGQDVTFSATVEESGPTATGNVTFFDNSTSLGTAVLLAGRTTFTTSNLTPGDHNITARFVGTGRSGNSTSSATRQTVRTRGPAGTAAPGLPVTGGKSMLALALALLLLATGATALQIAARQP